MTLYTENLRSPNTPTLYDVQGSLSDGIHAAFQKSLLESPTYSIQRYLELRGATISEPQSVASRRFPGYETNVDAPKIVVPQDEAKERLREQRFSFPIPEEGISEDALNILIDRARMRREIDARLAMSPQGFFPGLVKMGSMLAAQLLDPLNVATAFIPIVGPARYAAAVKSAPTMLGRAAVRARYGVVEGAVGAAAVEPIVYGVAQTEYADYTMYDSLAAVGFGTLFGAGLHSGAGFFSDVVTGATRRRPTLETPEHLLDSTPQQRVEASRTTLAQVDSGRAVNVEHYDELRRTINEIQPQTMHAARQRARAEIALQSIEELRQTADQRLSPQQVDALRKDLALADGGSVAADLEASRLRATRSELAARLREQEGLSQRAAENKADAEIRKSQEAIKRRQQELTEKPSERAKVEAQLDAHQQAEDASYAISRIEKGKLPADLEAKVEPRARQLLSEAGKRPLSTAEKNALGNKYNAVRAQARAAPDEPHYLAEPALLNDAEMQVKDAPSDDLAEVTDELADVEEQVQALADALPEEVRADFAEVDAAVKETQAKANRLVKGLEAGVACRMAS